MDSVLTHLTAAKNILVSYQQQNGGNTGQAETNQQRSAFQEGEDGQVDNLDNLDATLVQAPDRPINENFEWDGGASLVAFDAQGAGTDQLASGMEGISDFLVDNQGNFDDPIAITPELQAHLQDIAEARGISFEQAEQDFQRTAHLIGEANDLHLESSDRGYGSTSQLRFGHVIGESLEIDPAFASILSPTGGLTGPGGRSANIDGGGIFEEIAEFGVDRIIPDDVDFAVSNEALAYHSPTHDGFGFLEKQFGVGPGYCYAEGECAFTDDNGNPTPLSGQFSGIDYWENQTQRTDGEVIAEGASEVFEEFREGAGEVASEYSEGQMEVERERNEAREEIREEFSEAGQEILGDLADGDFVGATGEFAEGAAEIAGEAIEGAFETGREEIEGGLETGGEILEGGAEILREGAEGILDWINN